MSNLFFSVLPLSTPSVNDYQRMDVGNPTSSPLETPSLFDFTSFPVSIQAPALCISLCVKSPSDRSTVSTLGTHPRPTVRPFMPGFAGFIDRSWAFAEISMSRDQTSPSVVPLSFRSRSLSLSLCFFFFSRGI